MRLLLVADGRSPITRRWIKMLQPLGYAIYLASTYPCSSIEGVQEIIEIPLAFAGMAGSQAGSAARKTTRRTRMIARLRAVASDARHWLGPMTVDRKEKNYIELLARVKPHLVHALRIPFEGMLAGLTPVGIPVILSTWGNDLTYHAETTNAMAASTRRALLRANGLMSDTQRDIKLARAWSFNPAKPAMSVPGNGGIDLGEIEQATRGIGLAVPWQVINPRGFRSGSVRNDTFFKSIPHILKQHANTQFICPWMAGQPEALRWIEDLRIFDNVTLLPMLSQPELWREFARSMVSVSVSVHDGTPNSLLEAMTVGCLPVCGDIESIRDWILNGENGLLVDPSDPKALAQAVLRGIEDEGLRRMAASHNLEIILARAEVSAVRRHVADFYNKVIDNGD
jgi:hypothetical protein